MGVRYFCDRCEKEFKSGGLKIPIYAHDALGMKIVCMNDGLLCEECTKKFNIIKNHLKYEEDFFTMKDDEVSLYMSIKDAINYFEYGISHDIFSEPVTTYAKLAVEALEKQLKEE